MRKEKVRGKVLGGVKVVSEWDGDGEKVGVRRLVGGCKEVSGWG